MTVCLYCLTGHLDRYGTELDTPESTMPRPKRERLNLNPPRKESKRL